MEGKEQEFEEAMISRGGGRDLSVRYQLTNSLYKFDRD